MNCLRVTILLWVFAVAVAKTGLGLGVGSSQGSSSYLRGAVLPNHPTWTQRSLLDVGSSRTRSVPSGIPSTGTEGESDSEGSEFDGPSGSFAFTEDYDFGDSDEDTEVEIGAGAIIGIVVGIVLLCCSLASVVACCCCGACVPCLALCADRHQRKQQQKAAMLRAQMEAAPAGAYTGVYGAPMPDDPVGEHAPGVNSKNIYQAAAAPPPPSYDGHLVPLGYANDKPAY